MKIHNAYYSPRKFKMFKMPWENTLFLGTELELELNRNHSVHSKADIMGEFLEEEKNDMFYFKDDASLNNGIEFVSHPFTLQYLHHEGKMEKFFKKLKKEEFQAKDNCGIHIHLSKKFFTSEELQKLRIFFSVNRVEIMKFSKKTAKSIYDYSKYEMFSMKDFLRAPKTVTQDHRYALNLTTHLSSTIEIRVFRATLDYKKFLSILQFCDAIGNFVKEINIVAIADYKKSWKLFLGWCKTAKTYKQFLKDKDIC